MRVARFVFLKIDIWKLTFFLAVLFGYFMNLVLIGNEAKILEEQTRLSRLSTLLDEAGMSEYVYEDWVNASLTLLGELVAALKNGRAIEVIERAFNDEENSPMLVQHLRVRLSLPSQRRELTDKGSVLGERVDNDAWRRVQHVPGRWER